jgi:hypothetical protein
LTEREQSVEREHQYNAWTILGKRRNVTERRERRGDYTLAAAAGSNPSTKGALQREGEGTIGDLPPGAVTIVLFLPMSREGGERKRKGRKERRGKRS